MTGAEKVVKRVCGCQYEGVKNKRLRTISKTLEKRRVYRTIPTVTVPFSCKRRPNTRREGNTRKKIQVNFWQKVNIFKNGR